MTFGQRFGHFLLFVLLTIITAGLYPIYCGFYQSEERNALLVEIRDYVRSGGR